MGIFENTMVVSKVSCLVVLLLAIAVSSQEVQPLNDNDIVVLLEESKSIAEMEKDVQGAKIMVAAASKELSSADAEGAAAKQTIATAKSKAKTDISEVVTTVKKAEADIDEKVNAADDDAKLKLKKTETAASKKQAATVAAAK